MQRKRRTRVTRSLHHYRASPRLISHLPQRRRRPRRRRLPVRARGRCPSCTCVPCPSQAISSLSISATGAYRTPIDSLRICRECQWSTPQFHNPLTRLRRLSLTRRRRQIWAHLLRRSHLLVQVVQALALALTLPYHLTYPSRTTHQTLTLPSAMPSTTARFCTPSTTWMIWMRSRSASGSNLEFPLLYTLYDIHTFECYTITLTIMSVCHDIPIICLQHTVITAYNMPAWYDRGRGLGT